MLAIAKTSAVSLETARDYIESLDLNYLIDSMCAPHYPLPRWIKPDALQCCKLYKNFLFLMKKYPEATLIPTREIDEFWHNHILYTRNYTRDCLNIYGHYLHHVPTSPIDDIAVLKANYAKTHELYLIEFDQPLTLIGPTP